MLIEGAPTVSLACLQQRESYNKLSKSLDLGMWELVLKYDQWDSREMKFEE